MVPRRRWVQAAVVAALMALVGGRWLAVGTADRLWADALGVAASHGDIARLRLLLLATALSAALLWCLGNLYLVYRSIGSVHVPRRLGNIEILEAVPRRYLLLLALGIGAVLALLLSHSAGGWWRVRALAGVSATFGLTDPILGRDLAYYVFRLPWHRTLHSFATVLSGVLLGVVAVLYAAVGAVRWEARRVHVTELARSHLGMVLAAFALALAWGYQLEPAEYVAGIHTVPLDAVLTGVRVPATRLLSALAFVTAGASILWAWAGRAAVAIVSWGVLAAASLAGHYVVPAFAGATRSAEALPLPAVSERAEEFAALALGALPPAEVVRPPVVPEPERLSQYVAALARAPIWDGFALTVSLNRTARSDPYTAFHEVALVSYPTGPGAATPVFLGVRRIDLATARAADSRPSWEEVHAGRYRYASGAVGVLAHRTSSDGLPLFVSDLARPEAAAARVVDLPLERSEVLFAPGIADFAVLPPGADYVAGVAAGGLWRRLALAWVLQSPQLVLSEAASADAQLLWKRDVVDRLERFAPFAVFGAPYPAVVSGRVYWLATGYVAAEGFPLAPALRWRGRTVRYLRAGFVGVVEAASGSTAVYLVADPDPVSAAWAELAPDIVRPDAALPVRLRPHLRYPEETFALLLDRVSEVRFADEAGAGALLSRGGRSPIGSGAFWWFGPVPGDSVARLRLVALVEAGEATALAGLLVGTWQGAPGLRLFRFDPAENLPAPAQVAREFAALRPDTAGVNGAVRFALVDHGLVALQTGYAGSRDPRDAPRLVDIAVRWGGAVATGPSLEEALRRAATRQPPTAVPIDTWRAAARWFERMDAARRAGDWTAFGEAYEALRRLLAGAPDGAR